MLSNYEWGDSMPRFLIERNFAEQLEITKEGVEGVIHINEEEGVKWLFSFLSPDKRTCLRAFLSLWSLIHTMNIRL
jgi:hypothetical protein